MNDRFLASQTLLQEILDQSVKLQSPPLFSAVNKKILIYGISINLTVLLDKKYYHFSYSSKYEKLLLERFDILLLETYSFNH